MICVEWPGSGGYGFFSVFVALYSDWVAWLGGPPKARSGLAMHQTGQISQRLRSMRTRAGLPICQQSENLPRMGSTDSRFRT